MKLAALLLISQVAPGVFTTVKTTSTAATSLCVGCPIGTTTPAANSGATVRTIVLPVSGAPSDTTLKIYQVGGALFFNGLSLATGSSISGTTNTVPKFTAPTVLGDSTITDNGTTVTIAALTQSNGTVTSGTNGAVGGLLVNGPAATNRQMVWRTAGVNRWIAVANSTAESGSNAGSNWRLMAFTDAGSSIGDALSITRSTMDATFGAALTVTGTTALSGGATVATSLQLTGAAPVYLGNTNNGYLFRNSTNGATLLSITDAGVGTFANAYNVTGATRLGTGSTTAGWGTNAAGDWTYGATEIIVDSSGTPVITSGFGTTGKQIFGRDYSFRIRLGSEANTGGVVTFGHAFSNTIIPVCVATGSGGMGAITLTLTDTTATIAYASISGGTNDVSVLCRGKVS